VRVKKRRAAAIAVMASTSYAVACSLLVDTAGLGGESAPDSSIDASSDGTTLAESAADANIVDAGTTCEATFCDDFDEGGLGAKWTSKEVTNGGLLELGGPARSAPNALRTHFSITSGPSDRIAILERDLGAGSHLRCDVSIFVESPPSSSFIDVLRIRTTAPDVTDYNLLFGLNPAGGATFREDIYFGDGGCGCPRKDSKPPPLPLAQWVRLSIETDFTNASLAYDGQVVSAAPFAAFKPSSNVFVAIGSIAYQAQPSVVLFDDLSCTLAP
jgi:hypothetical protein